MIRNKCHIVALSISIIISCLHASYAQEKIPEFFQVISGDSVVLFFNRHFQFTEQTCFDFTRAIRVTESGNFNGYFEDRGTDHALLGKGSYYNGAKHGYFELYYPNGKIICRGFYENNKPIGIWEFFYETGLPERTLNITASEVLLDRFINKNGKIKVQNGQGKFDGNVNIYGEVVDGRPHGKWMALNADGNPFYTEKFKNGRLIKSSGFYSAGTHERKSSTTLLANFFPGNYLTLLEKFQVLPCSYYHPYILGYYGNDLKNALGIKSTRYSPSKARRVFNADLRSKISFLVENDLRLQNGKHYATGESSLHIQFSLSQQGRADNFEILPDSDPHLTELLSSMVLNTLSKSTFLTREKTQYFRLRFSYAGGYFYRFTFTLSEKPEKK